MDQVEQTRLHKKFYLSLSPHAPKSYILDAFGYFYFILSKNKKNIKNNIFVSKLNKV